MSQSRFSIVLVGVSALLRRPLVSRLRPADGERSSWVVFTARGCRFDSGFRWAGWPSGSLLPLFGMRRFGVAVRRVGLRASASEIALGGLALLPSASEIAVRRVGASAFRFGNCPRRVGASAFRFGNCRSAGWRFCLPLRRFRWASWFFRLPLRKLPSAGWPSGSPLPLFGAYRFGDCPRRVGLRVHRFRFSERSDSGLPSAGWPSGSLLPLFGTHRSAPPRRRSEDRRSTTTRHLFHFKHLSQHVNLPHRTP